MSQSNKIPVLFLEIWHHLLKIRKIQLILLFLLMLFSAVAEIVSLGAVMPFIGIMTAPEAFLKSDLVTTFINPSLLLKNEQLRLTITIIFIFMIILSNSMRLFVMWFTTAVSHLIGTDLTSEVFRRSLFQPYIVHIRRNSSEVISGTGKVSAMVNMGLLPGLSFLSNSILLVSIVGTLIIIDPVITFSTVFGFGVMYYFISVLTRSRLKRNSEIIARGATNIHKVIQEGLGGIRDVLLDGTQKFYYDTFKIIDLSTRKSEGSNVFLAGAPRYTIEAIGVTLIAIVAYVLSEKPGGVTNFFPIIGALVFGSQRILPALQQCYASWSGVTGSQKSIQDALVLLNQPISEDLEKSDIMPMQFKKDILLNNIRFRYTEQSPWIIDGLSVAIKKGERIGIIGKTGSGKSTIIDIIMGLLEPTEGEILIDGKAVNSTMQLSWRKNVSHVPQHIFLTDSSVAENIAFGINKNEINLERVKLSAYNSQINKFIEKYPSGYDTFAGERGIRLSGGQRQRIGIARALYKQTCVLVLDEATSALDDLTEKAVMESINNLGREMTIIIIAHRTTTLQGCDRIIELSGGKIIREGTYKEIIGDGLDWFVSNHSNSESKTN